MCAALLPAVLWLWPALAEHRALSFRDQGDFFYPLKLYTADRMRAGEIPLWNPLSGAGEPWLANGQSGVFYPPNLLFMIPSPALAAGLFLLLHFAIAVWGARRFLKEENVSEAGALFGAAAFAACGYAASLSAFWNHFGGFAYVPGIAAVARGGLRSRAAMLGLATLVGLQAMTGSPEMSFVSIALAIALALAPRREFPDPIVALPRAVSARRLGAAVALGLALAAWVLVPMAELALRSDRRHPIPAAARDYGDLAAPAARSAVGFGGPAGASAYLVSVYTGPLILLAAAAAFAEEHRRRLAVILAAFALAGMLLAMHGPPGEWLRAIAPFDRVRYPAKWLAWTVFAAAILAGLGVDSLRFAASTPRRRLAAAALLLLGGAACALAPQPDGVRWSGAAGCAALALCALVRARAPGRRGAPERGGLGGARRLARPRVEVASALRPRGGAAPLPLGHRAPLAGGRPRRHASHGGALGLGPSRRPVRRDDAAAAAGVAARLHESDVPRPGAADRGPAEDRRRRGDRGLRGRGRGRDACGRRERAVPVDADPAVAPSVAEDGGLLPRAARALPTAALVPRRTIASSPTPSAPGSACPRARST